MISKRLRRRAGDPIGTTTTSIYTERYLGMPKKNEKGYRDSSPVKYAAQLKGKLLIAHGTGDDNVHFANTLYCHQRAHRGREVRLKF